jgi:hypothetical protein
MPTPGDLSLAVGDGSRRMTYPELAQARGISLASARRLARRHHWHRQAGNDGVVRIIVPLGHLRTGPQPDPANSAEILEIGGPGPAYATSEGTRPRPAPDGPGARPTPDTLTRAVDLLREQLALANSRVEAEHARADRAEERAAAALARVDELQTALAKALAEVSEERRRVIDILTGDRRPWWRRWVR